MASRQRVKKDMLLQRTLPDSTSSSFFVQLHGPRDRQSPDSTPLEFLYMGMSLISLSSPSPTQQPLPTNSYSSHIEKWFFSSLQTTSNSTPTRRLLSVVSSLKTCLRVRLHPHIPRHRHLTYTSFRVFAFQMSVNLTSPFLFPMFHRAY